MNEEAGKRDDRSPVLGVTDRDHGTLYIDQPGAWHQTNLHRHRCGDMVQIIEVLRRHGLDVCELCCVRSHGTVRLAVMIHSNNDVGGILRLL
jgi:hypothetical protein